LLPLHDCAIGALRRSIAAHDRVGKRSRIGHAPVFSWALVHLVLRERLLKVAVAANRASQVTCIS